jgi:hypothetical protein
MGCELVTAGTKLSCFNVLTIKLFFFSHYFLCLACVWFHYAPQPWVEYLKKQCTFLSTNVRLEFQIKLQGPQTWTSFIFEHGYGVTNGGFLCEKKGKN